MGNYGYQNMSAKEIEEELAKEYPKNEIFDLK